MSEPDRLLTIATVSEMVCYTPKHIRHMVKTGRFCTPVRVGPNRVAFRSSEVMAWLEALPRCEPKA